MSVNYEDFEIVGFGGVPIIETGISPPIGHIINSNNYFMADGNFYSKGLNVSTDQFDLKELQDSAREGGLTLVKTSKKMFRDAAAIYAENEFLSKVGSLVVDSPANSIFGFPLDWQEVEMCNKTISTPFGSKENPKVYVSFTHEDAGYKIRDGWANILIDDAKSNLRMYYGDGEDLRLSQAHYLSVSARCAKSPNLRKEAILLNALTQEQDKDKVIRIYNLIYKVEFNEEDWDSFQGKLKGLEQELRNY